MRPRCDLTDPLQGGLVIPLRETKKKTVADAAEMLSKASTQTGAGYEQYVFQSHTHPSQPYSY